MRESNSARSAARTPSAGERHRSPLGSAGATARIETVLLTHLAHDLDVLAAGDETDDGRGQLAARDCAFDDVSLPAAVSRISALGIDHAAIVDRPVFGIRNLRPPILRPAWIDDRKTDRLADDL